MSSPTALVTTRMFIRRCPEQPKVYEFSFMRQSPWQAEPLHLYMHEVEFQKWVKGIHEFATGARDQSGAEGVYVSYEGPIDVTRTS